MVCVMKLKIFGLILLVLQTVITCSYFNKVFFFKLKSVKKRIQIIFVYFCMWLPAGLKSDHGSSRFFKPFNFHDLQSTSPF